MVSPFLQ